MYNEFCLGLNGITVVAITREKIESLRTWAFPFVI